MRYTLAMLCPPLAIWMCGRPTRAAICAILFIVAIATAEWGIGAVLDFFLILWATHAVGDEAADREARAFASGVKPIPVIRD